MAESIKTILVTGASRGIGRATARALGGPGTHVVVHYFKNADKADAVVDEIRADGGKATALQGDLATEEGPAALADKISSVIGDRLDVAVFNAGIARAAKIPDQGARDIDEMFATNVRAPILLMKHLYPLLGQGSSVVLVSSFAGRGVPGNPGQASAPAVSAYGATKGAVDALVRHWASALGPQGIRVNAVAPGVIETDMGQSAKTPAGRELTLGMQALKRIGQPADVADVIAFLASDRARWITGVCLPVDGGAKL